MSNFNDILFYCKQLLIKPDVYNDFLKFIFEKWEDFPQDKGAAALMLCCKYVYINQKFYDVAKILLLEYNNCFNINEKNYDENTTFMVCCKRAHTSKYVYKLAKLMINKVDLNIQNIDGDTALMLCAPYVNLFKYSNKLANLILSMKNVNYYLKNKKGETVLDVYNKYLDRDNNALEICKKINARIKT